MTEKCPTCGRAFRKPKQELTEFERIRVKVRKLESANLRKPMPKATVYKR